MRKCGFRVFSFFSVLILTLGLLASPAAAQKKIDLNSATKAELAELPGIGPVIADHIIAARPIRKVDDLKLISGIDEATFDKIKALVTVSAAPSGEPVDINTADKAALDVLPGVGPVIAARIIAARPFKKLDDLIKVNGIGEATFEKIKNLVTIEDDDTKVAPTLKPGQKININRATQKQIEMLLGIGPTKAKAVIESRPFAAKEDIMKVKGIKEKIFAKIKDYIVVK